MAQRKAGEQPLGEQNGENENPQNPQSPQQMAAEMAKAFQELAKGEQTASALEKQLDGIESRIEELLAAAEASASQSGMQERSGEQSADSSSGAAKK